MYQSTFFFHPYYYCAARTGKKNRTAGCEALDTTNVQSQFFLDTQTVFWVTTYYHLLVCAFP